MVLIGIPSSRSIHDYPCPPTGWVGWCITSTLHILARRALSVHLWTRDFCTVYVHTEIPSAPQLCACLTRHDIRQLRTISTIWSDAPCISLLDEYSVPNKVPVEGFHQGYIVPSWSVCFPLLHAMRSSSSPCLACPLSPNAAHARCLLLFAFFALCYAFMFLFMVPPARCNSNPSVSYSVRCALCLSEACEACWPTGPFLLCHVSVDHR